MALKTNSKEVKQAVKNYIVDCFEVCDESEIYKTFEERAGRIAETFKKEARGASFEEFRGWLAGLPSCALGDDVFLSDAGDLVAEWLKQTTEEKEKYNREESERLAALLIYREIEKYI